MYKSEPTWLRLAEQKTTSSFFFFFMNVENENFCTFLRYRANLRVCYGSLLQLCEEYQVYGESNRMRMAVSYTHLTLPTRRTV